jgi:hypothetical protein
VLRTEPASRVFAGQGDVEHFAFEAELDRQRLVFDYYVSRQTSGGATIAATLPQREAAGLQKDVERIATSVKLTPPRGKK